MSANTIILRGGRGRREEAPADGTNVKPGHVVIRNLDNEFALNTLASGADTELNVAIEDALQGKTVNDAYALASIIFTYVPLPGDIIQMRLPAAATAVIIGDRVQLDNTGCVIKLASGKPIGVVKTAVDNSAGGSEAFVPIEIL